MPTLDHCKYHFKIETHNHFHEQDGASLIRAVVSKEAKFFRQQFCGVFADMLYQWILEALGQGITTTQYGSHLTLDSRTDNRGSGPSSRLSTPTNDYHSILRDRRLKVIFSKILNSARRDPILMLWFYWVSFVMFVTSSALACHRVLVSLSEAYLGPLKIAPKRYAIGA